LNTVKTEYADTTENYFGGIGEFGKIGVLQ